MNPVLDHRRRARRPRRRARRGPRRLVHARRRAVLHQPGRRVRARGLRLRRAGRRRRRLARPGADAHRRHRGGLRRRTRRARRARRRRGRRGRSPRSSPARGRPWCSRTTTDAVLADPAALLAECFGPSTLIVEYADVDDALAAIRAVGGSLTATVHAEPGEDLADILAVLTEVAGRVLFAGWPTGVAVSWAQQHGGPWPSTTSIHTSVGVTAIRRFLRPVAYQDAPGCGAARRAPRRRTRSASRGASTACSSCPGRRSAEWASRATSPPRRRRASRSAASRRDPRAGGRAARRRRARRAARRRGARAEHRRRADRRRRARPQPPTRRARRRRGARHRRGLHGRRLPRRRAALGGRARARRGGHGDAVRLRRPVELRHRGHPRTSAARTRSTPSPTTSGRSPDPRRSPRPPPSDRHASRRSSWRARRSLGALGTIPLGSAPRLRRRTPRCSARSPRASGTSPRTDRSRSSPRAARVSQFGAGGLTIAAVALAVAARRRCRPRARSSSRRSRSAACSARSGTRPTPSPPARGRDGPRLRRDGRVHGGRGARTSARRGRPSRSACRACSPRPSAAAMLLIRKQQSPPTLRSQVFTVGAGLRAAAAAAGAAVAGLAAGSAGRRSSSRSALVWILSGAMLLAYPKARARRSTAPDLTVRATDTAESVAARPRLTALPLAGPDDDLVPERWRRLHRQRLEIGTDHASCHVIDSPGKTAVVGGMPTCPPSAPTSMIRVASMPPDRAWR